MADHPSMEGLREALGDAVNSAPGDPSCHRCPHARNGCCWEHMTQFVMTKMAAYLTEHGVGWFGQGLVRAVEVGVETPDGELLPFDAESRPGVTRPVAALVPVPQDGET